MSTTKGKEKKSLQDRGGEPSSHLPLSQSKQEEADGQGCSRSGRRALAARERGTASYLDEALRAAVVLAGGGVAQAMTLPRRRDGKGEEERVWIGLERKGIFDILIMVCGHKLKNKIHLQC
jgi:hypothetical protein